jgi:hydrogenase/urease accessory protein HupE
VVALAAAAPTVARGVAFLLGFALASVVAMGVATWAWGRLLEYARELRIAAGLASVAVGVVLFAEVLGVAVPVPV